MSRASSGLAAFAAAVLAIAPVAGAGQADLSAGDAAELAEARGVIEIMFPPAQREETFRTLIGQLKDQIAASIDTSRIEDRGLRDILDRSLERVPERLMPTVNAYLPRLFAAMAVAYTHEFDLTELKAIHAFAQTPAGAHYLARSAALIGDPAVAEVNSAYFAEIQALNETYRRELQQEIAEYMQAHPDVARKVEGSRSN